MERQDQHINIESPNSNNNTTNTSIEIPKLCLSGCGFYGNAANEWNCSKCYKAILAKQLHTQSTAVNHNSNDSCNDNDAHNQSNVTDITLTAPTSDNKSSAATSTDTPVPTVDISFNSSLDTRVRHNSFNDVTQLLQSIQRSSTPIPLDILSPTILPVSKSNQLESAVVQQNTQSISNIPHNSKNNSISVVSSTSSFKKVRCMVCHKKLGALSYQTCRCSTDEHGQQIPDRIFCNEHRHTFTHDCTFDIKKLQTQVLHKSNPEIKGTKFEKI